MMVDVRVSRDGVDSHYKKFLNDKVEQTNYRIGDIDIKGRTSALDKSATQTKTVVASFKPIVESSRYRDQVTSSNSMLLAGATYTLREEAEDKEGGNSKSVMQPPKSAHNRRPVSKPRGSNEQLSTGVKNSVETSS